MSKMKYFICLSFAALSPSLVLADSVELQSGQGAAEVINFGQSSLVQIDGDAAKVLFNALIAKPYTPPASSSIIKRKSGVECTQNEENFSCLINVKN